MMRQKTDYLFVLRRRKFGVWMRLECSNWITMSDDWDPPNTIISTSIVMLCHISRLFETTETEKSNIFHIPNNFCWCWEVGRKLYCVVVYSSQACVSCVPCLTVYHGDHSPLTLITPLSQVWVTGCENLQHNLSHTLTLWSGFMSALSSTIVSILSCLFMGW